MKLTDCQTLRFLICQMPKFQAEEIVTMEALACIYIIQVKRTAIKK